jgi:hypothetical protein
MTVVGTSAEIVVHGMHKQGVQIGYIARQMKRHDLPLAVRRNLIAAGNALEHDADNKGLLADTGDILIGPQLPGWARKRR